jgi:hypothetical protein
VDEHPMPTNPYAPAATEPSGEFASQWGTSSGGISSVRVCVQTVGGIAASGGLFALGLAIFSTMAGGMPGPVSEQLMFAITTSLTLTAMGAVYACLVGAIVVPLLYAVAFHSLLRVDGWSASRVRRFALISGSLSGFLSVVTPTAFFIRSAPFSPTEFGQMLLFALVPALVGGVGTLLMAIPLARRAAREIDMRTAFAERSAQAARTTPPVA